MNLIKKYFFLTVFFLFQSGYLHSQLNGNAHIFEPIEKGITQVASSVINQDSEGFLWIGTHGVGLYRFDGIEYLHYKHERNDAKSIDNNLIHSIHVDANDLIWIGTEQGLNLYNKDLGNFIRIPLEENNKSKHTVRAIVSDDNGNIIVGTYGKGIFLINKKTLKSEKILNSYQGIDQGILITNSLIKSKEGKIYAGTNFGLYEVNLNKQYLNKVKISLKNKDNKAYNIQSMILDRKNMIWLGTAGNGVVQIQKKQGNEAEVLMGLNFTNKRVLALAQLPDNTLMFGSENDGLFHYDERGGHINTYLTENDDVYGIPSNSIWSLMVDKEHRIWMGTFNGGLLVSDQFNDKFGDLSNSLFSAGKLSDGSPSSIIKDAKGNLWIALDGGGIDIYNPVTGYFQNINTNGEGVYKGLTSNYIISLYMDSKKNIWAGSWDNGLFLLKNGTTKFENFNMANTNGQLASNAIMSITEDSRGTIWFGTFYKGLHSYNHDLELITHYNSEKFLQLGIQNSNVRVLLADRDDNIWIGTSEGLYILIQSKFGEKSIRSMIPQMADGNKTPANANHVSTIFQSDNKDIWIGTRGAGLCKFNFESQNFIWYDGSKNIKEESVYGITESSSGDIWFSGNNGITKLDPENGTATNYNINDGLLSNDFIYNSVYKDEHGLLYFGSYKGVNYFDPKEITTNKILAKPYLLNLKLFNETVEINKKNSPLPKAIQELDSISFTHQQDVFTIEYSSIAFTRPEKNQYAFYLEGLEKDWNYVAGGKSATYTNLDPGDYVFKLKAANNDGIWNESPLEFKVSVLPPWWLTNFALFAYCALLIGAVFLIAMIVKNRLKQRQLIRENEIEREQKDKLHEQKLQFFVNISHEFRTPLTLIKNPLEDIIDNKNLKLPNEVKRKHNIIYKNADRLSKLINELMDFRKLELNKMNLSLARVDAVGELKNIVSYFKEESRLRNIELVLEIGVHKLDVETDPSLLEKIMFNLLSNAFKATPEGGTINVGLYPVMDTMSIKNKESSPSYFEIFIADSGTGLPSGEETKIFDRFYQIDSLNNAYYGGTGIGLEVVRSFVTLLNGKIEVKSSEGVGTTFKIILPCTYKIEQLEQLQNHNLSRPKYTNKINPELNLPQTIESDLQSEETTTDKTLLIVEDNTELRNYLKNEFKGIYKILTAKNGSEGYSVAKRELPNIIISDILMPEMDGIQFCKLIKNDMATSHIPILMLTAKTMQEDFLKGIHSGADDYILKPFDMKVLKAKLYNLIHTRQLLFDKYFSLINGNFEQLETFDRKFMQKTLSYINTNLKEPRLTIEKIAEELHMSRSQFYRKIKKLTNYTASEFLRNLRLQKAKLLLESEKLNVVDVCNEVGFTTPSYFTKCFKLRYGYLPSEVMMGLETKTEDS